MSWLRHLEDDVNDVVGGTDRVGADGSSEEDICYIRVSSSRSPAAVYFKAAADSLNIVIRIS